MKPQSNRPLDLIKRLTSNLSFGPSVAMPLAIVLMLVVAAAAGYRLEIDAIGLRFEPQSVSKQLALDPP